ncbi:unnamed protein product [Adineta ricciae]|uniref:NmrA-like family domain-containing protein 1 n=1 Tax=Adineta ricciae TaxID=249248 RepID=A0A813RFK8_ADIRI|nr:unnamed protein product [Adineta ricciae]CAF0840340.1 unnamed protein product [Adineta ricciae]
MTCDKLVTIVDVTGAQASAVLKAFGQTGKYKAKWPLLVSVCLYVKFCSLTHDPTSEKAQVAQRRLDENIEILLCDIRKKDDVERAFKDSYSFFALTDFWTQPDKRDVAIHEGIIMADVAALLEIPYYIFSAQKDATKISDGKP